MTYNAATGCDTARRNAGWAAAIVATVSSDSRLVISQVVTLFGVNIDIVHSRMATMAVTGFLGLQTGQTRLARRPWSLSGPQPGRAPIPGLRDPCGRLCARRIAGAAGHDRVRGRLGVLAERDPHHVRDAPRELTLSWTGPDGTPDRSTRPPAVWPTFSLW